MKYFSDNEPRVFRMHFPNAQDVHLYEEVPTIRGSGVVLSPVAILDSVEAARDMARSLCPEGCKLRLLKVQPEQLAGLYY